MTGLPSFSIVIPTYNREEVVERTLLALLSQDYPPDLVEIIVVDNSTDGTPVMVERLARTTGRSLRLVARAPRLPAVKRNLGLRRATGELVLFLNDDVWASPQLLAHHAAAHRTHAVPTAVLGHVDQSTQMPSTAFIEAYRPFAYHELEGQAGRPVPWRYFWSMNISLPRAEMLSRNLLFHEDWSEIGNEDVELGYRWTKAGRAIIYEPRAWVEHYHPHTLESACRLQESVGRGLRDLEQLVPEPRLLERYGVFSWRNSPRAVVRGIVRGVLFNGVTAPLARRWLEARSRNTPLTRWMYWKVLLHYTNRGYRHGSRRPQRPLSIRPPEVEAVR